MKNTGVEIIGIDVTKIAEDKFDHKVVSETKFKSYEEAGRSLDNGEVKGFVFFGLPTYD